MTISFALLTCLAILILVIIKEAIAVVLETRKEPNNELEVNSDRNYVLNVVKIHEDGGASSHWYGWSDKWLFTWKEAVEKKAQIENNFDEVEILEHNIENEEIKSDIKLALESSGDE